MDLFPIKVGNGGPPPNAPPLAATTKGLTMGYYDGNTVTAYWNYAQHFAMSDNSYNTTFGPSTPGLLNLVAGQTNGLTQVINGTGSETDGGNGSLTVVGDPDPIGDVCSAPARNQVQMSGKYYASTLNKMHTRPASVSEIGHNGPANHEYDINDFFAAVKVGNMPAVSFLKAPAFQDGHAGYSNPLDEQTFLVNVINFLQKSREWNETAVVVLYDDSDGWYDHQIGPIVNQSTSPADALTGPGACGDGSTALSGPDPSTNLLAQGRCGYEPPQPLIVISPWAKENFVDHTVTDQTSILRFIEDNWLDGKRIGGGSFDAIANSIVQMFSFEDAPHWNSSGWDGKGWDGTLILDPTTGESVEHPDSN